MKKLLCLLITPRKLPHEIKADGTYTRHEAMPGSRTGQTMAISKNAGLL
jgi:hypothetical protein